MKELVNTADMDKLLKIDLPDPDGEQATLRYAIIDTEKYIEELYHDYKITIKQALEEENYKYLQGLVDGELQIMTHNLNEDAIKDKCHLKNDWDSILPSSQVVLKQMKYFNAKYSLFIYQASPECSNYELHPLTRVAIQTIINGNNHPSDVGLNYNEDMYLGKTDACTLKEIKDVCAGGADNAWIDVSQAYPKKNSKCIVKSNL